MLELTHIQKSFDGVTVLKDISMQVEEGEIVSILGPSGCGKTTLLNLILGIGATLLPYTSLFRSLIVRFEDSCPTRVGMIRS